MLLPSAVVAQKISFKSTTQSIGNVLWNKPTTVTFKFTNKDKTPLRIENVDAGCGCLTSEWTKQAIQKGESGEINITYDAKTLGHFDKIIEVYTNSSNKPHTLRIKGVVTTGNAKTLDETYPCHIDNIYLSTNDIVFPDVYAGDTSKFVLEIFNNSTDVYEPQLMHLPSYITASSFPKMIARGRRGRIELTLHADRLTNLGLTQTSVYLARYSGDKVGTGNEISVSAVMLPALQNASNVSRKPVLSVSTKELNLGKVGKKSKINAEVIIKNEGNALLKLSNIQAFNHAISINLPKRELDAGESIKMKVQLQTRYLGMSKSQPRILIISNDSACPKVVININFEK